MIRDLGVGLGHGDECMSRTVFILPHTHWDREWYLPFERFRMRLVRTVDQLLTIMRTDPTYERFTLDGQSIILDDYLAIRPHQEQALRALVAQRRLAVGPWYVLPDEFLVSGEALIRNLMIGRHKATRFGPPVDVGYLPDSFGHIAQLPQILRGFGITSAMLSRGVGDEGETLGSEFWWEALDGSRVLLVHQVRGYCNGAALGYPLPTVVFEGRDPDLDLAVGRVRRELELLTPYARAGVILLNNGCDHLPPSPHLPRIIDHLRRAFPEVQWRWGTPAEVVEEIIARHPTLGAWKGELRGSRYAPLIPGVLSTRIYLKQANEEAQTLLERWAEPVATAAWALGDPYPGDFLGYAWGLLLQNHPHDSICGCSVDAVHREMLTRFERVRAIGDEIRARSLRAIAERINTAALTSGLPLVVFNPLNWSRTEPVRCTVSLPSNMVPRLRIVDSLGRPVPHQVLGRSHEVLAQERVEAVQMAERLRCLSHELETAWGVHFAAFRLRRGTLVVEAADPGVCPPDVVDRIAAVLRPRRGPMTVKIERSLLEIAFLAADVPPVGYKTFVLTSRRTRTPAPSRGIVTVRGRTIENANIAVQVATDSGIVLRHRDTGRIYRGHVFEDTADAGDEYDYSPVGERAILTFGVKGRVETVQMGPVVGILRVHLPVRLPGGLEEHRRRRKRRHVECPVTVDVTIAAGSRRVEFKTTVENHAEDHRLRVLFPTGVTATHSAADTQFGVVERPVGRPQGDGWVQPPQPTAPHESWVDISNGRTGLAVLSVGLPEHEVTAEATGLTVALTLLRCVGRLSRNDLRTRAGHAGPGYATPEAQCQGVHHFRYALVPHVGGWQDADVVREALTMRVPLVAIATTRASGTLPVEHSFVACEGAIVSAIKQTATGNGVVIRVYNPTPEERRAVIRTAIPHRGVREVNLAEQHIGELASTGETIELPMRPFQIRTVTLIMNSE